MAGRDGHLHAWRSSRRTATLTGPCGSPTRSRVFPSRIPSDIRPTEVSTTPCTPSCRSGSREVKRNFASYRLLDDQVQFLGGWFKDTLPSAPIEQLALLRLDADLYESTLER